ncbi:DUF2145 domain-containing protein [Pseudoalteromonas ulvae]|uniref:DUF2145 domain-containing protein n=1 Tax=Pseudoalteromonas ulvae TaxID=107327 RepID=A0A244CPV6_PSEDV|nr:DUF2145 domain-containing protein [Pseudoalteromonas ulvae]OUL57239.1 hypothetical protein B1199_13800 [Pseudoalteromonas ulvae]
MKLNDFVSKWVILLAILISPAVFAGSTAKQSAHFSAEQISAFAKDVEYYAAKQGARAFIIARVGRPASTLPKGVSYTHTAVAIYSDITLADGAVEQGYAIHNLYQQAENSAQSELVIDYPVDFFWGAQQLKAGILIPTPQLQQQLIELVASGQHRKLHNPNYSVIANPFNNQFQNCTEFTLDMLNAAIYHTTESSKLKQNALAYFKPQVIKTNPLKLMFGALLLDEVSTADHPRQIQTATFSSLVAYLKRYQLSDEAIHFTSQAITVI